MNFTKNSQLWRFKWHIAIVYGILLALLLLTAILNIFRTSSAAILPQLLWLFLALILLTTTILILSKMFSMMDTLIETSIKLDRMISILEKNRALLAQINQNVRISEKAKTIAFRDTDKQVLRETVLDKLHQQDFENGDSMINEIAHAKIYKELPEQLKQEADKYRQSTDHERINQVVAHIENLIENCEWVKANAQIEKLLKAEPTSEKVNALRQKFLDKKEERKKILLNAWEDAVKRQATDRSLEILRELDFYLAPNEALAFQEQARNVFKNKLHSLGVQFSLAVAEKHWDKAIETGKQIIRDFPNSKISEEIREKMDVLQQKVTQQNK